MNQTSTAVRPPQSHHRPASGSAMSFGGISARSSRLFRGGLLLIAAAALCGLIHLFLSDSAFVGTYLLIAATTIASVWIWISKGGSGLPFLPLFLLQQGVIYALPLVVGDANLKQIPEGVVFQSGISVCLLLIFSTLGHHLGKRWAKPSSLSRGNFFQRQGPQELRRAATLALFMLGASVAFHLATRSGLLYQMLPGSLWRLFPVIRTLSDASALFGALIGGLCLSPVPRSPKALLYWGLLLSIFFLSIADALLSAATGLILATAVGQALGKARFPWLFLLAAFSLLGFLNQGKFAVRDKYWDSESNTTHLEISQLPSFYVEWAAASSEHLFGSSDDPAIPAARSRRASVENDGQSLLDRIDNFQILSYVIEAIEEKDMPVLSGKTYSLIPPLLIPRFLWANKPRTHEGQILLNLHFKRQKTVEQTEKTYIAWGLLPESIGNFGVFIGPVILGLGLGGVMGVLERFSYRKEIFSIEGILLVALLLKIITSFEMVSSVFVTSAFQFLVVVAAGGWLLRKWFQMGEARSHLRHRHQR